MSRTALLLGFLLLFGGAAAWLVLGGGGGPGGLLPPTQEESSGGAEKEAGKVPALPGGERPRRELPPENRPPRGNRPAAARKLSLLVSCPFLGGALAAEVRLLSREGRVLARSRTGADGRGVLELPSPAEGAVLAVDHPRCLPWRGSVPEGRKLLEVRLEAAGRITGKVLGRDGRPAAGARVFAGSDPSSGKVPSALTGGDGTFRLERVRPGRVEVTCILGAESRTKVVLLEKGGTAEALFDFTPKGPLLEGFLQDASGLPLKAWWLEVLDTAGKVRVLAETGRDGEFEVELPGPAEVELFAASGKDPALARVFLGRFRVGREGLAGLRLSLGAAGLAGRVVLEEGGSLPAGTVVAVWRMEKAGWALAGQVGAFDGEGRFSLEGLPAGTYRLSVRAPGFPDLLTWVGGLDRGVKDLGDLVLTRRGTGELLFLCRGKGGPPPRTFQAWRKDGDAWIPLELVPRGKHRFLARALPAGPVELRIEAPGFVPGEPKVKIEAGKVSRLTLEFVRGFPVTIRVELPGGGEAEKVFGRLSSRGPWIPAKRTGPGLWTFAALPRGTYTLLVKVPGYRAAPVEIGVPPGESPAAVVELVR